MKCKNCGNLIPDHSTFCPYCGVALEQIPVQPAVTPSLTMPYASVQQPLPSSGKPKKAKGKVQKCLKCGALLSKKEKACPICGEAMPKKPRQAKAAIISMSVVICLLLCSTIYFMLEMFQGNQAIDELRAEITSYSELTQKLNSDLAVQTRRAESWSRDYQDLKEEYDRVYRVACFYESYAVIVGDDDRYYHSHGCPDLDIFSFYPRIYNEFTARDRGYRPCPYCQ